ncbi:MAG: tRNA uridine-5-carboxymethylaminomethyl(34) synthesis GTPase MnmE, partial [Lachnospiraceae bacterium]|nr:tRNA uridine-5-carboxymethylaminomethyl(34) synthesis GTPase MnmE [Lachnospiraceae bacterium]
AFTLNVIDTAGITQTDDPIEKIGVERARGEREGAQLILYVADSSVELDDNDRDILGEIEGKRAICVMNKSDLAQALSEEEMKALMKDNQAVIPLSARFGTGIDQLKKVIEEMFFGEEAPGLDDVIVLGKRHEYALKAAIEALGQTIEGIEQGISEEFWLVDLKDTFDRLGEITGETVGENLIDEIFDKFCMGK